MMGNLYLDLGGDLGVSPSGGIAIAEGDVLSRQRVIRRLVSLFRVVKPDGTVLDGDYIEDNAYGTVLGRFIGSAPGPVDFDGMETNVRAALSAEHSVAQTQPPTINFALYSDGVLIQISYTSAYTGKPVAPINLLVS
jgi:hypothetical protein